MGVFPSRVPFLQEFDEGAHFCRRPNVLELVPSQIPAQLVVRVQSFLPVRMRGGGSLHPPPPSMPQAVGPGW